MEVTYQQLRCKEVICLEDGKKMGRITDLVFTFPEGKVCGITVPGEKSGLFKSAADILIELCQIQTIGEDVILVKGARRPPLPPKPDCRPCFRGRGQDDEE